MELSVGVRGDSAYVSADGRLTAWNLRTGARRFIAGLAFRELAVSQDGRRVAGFTREELVLVDVRTRAVRRRPWHPGPSNATWIGSDRVVVAGNGTLDTFDLSLRPVLPQQFWPAHTTAFTSVGPVGVNRQGELITIRNGDIHRLGRLFSPAVSVLVPL